jgi:hypothetical protein
MKRNSTDSRKENGNVTVAADDLVQLLNTWTFDSSRDEEDLVVPNKDSSAAHLYEHMSTGHTHSLSLY